MLMEITECFNDRHYQKDTTLYVTKITVEAGKVTIAFNCIAGDDRKRVIMAHIESFCKDGIMDYAIFRDFKGSSGRRLDYKKGFEIIVPTKDPSAVIQKMREVKLISEVQRDFCIEQITAHYVP